MLSSSGVLIRVPNSLLRHTNLSIFIILQLIKLVNLVPLVEFVPTYSALIKRHTPAYVLPFFVIKFSIVLIWLELKQSLPRPHNFLGQGAIHPRPWPCCCV
jgi:hypothetical protein